MNPAALQEPADGKRAPKLTCSIGIPEFEGK